MKFLFSASSTSHQITGNGNIKNRKFIYLEGDDTYIEAMHEVDPKQEDNKLSWYQSKIAASIGTVLLIVSGVANYYQFDENGKLKERVKTEKLAKDTAQNKFVAEQAANVRLVNKLTTKTADYNTEKAELEKFKLVEVIQDSTFTNKGELLKIIEASSKNYFAIDDGEGNTYFVDKKGNKIDNPNIIIKE